MRIVFTGGGTGGHIFPNIAIIRKLNGKSQKSKVEVVYIGGKNSMEQELLKKEGVPFYGIHAGKLRRYFDVKNIVDAFKIPLSLAESLVLLRSLKPNLVFSKGGYVSVPVVLAAALLKIPIWLHESDASPGLSTKIASRFAKKIFLAFEEAKAYFPAKKVEVVGNPVREEILKGKKEEGYRISGFSSELPVILIMGGSLGAQAINKLAAEILPELLERAQVVHITGPGPFPLFACPSQLRPRYQHFPFLEEELRHIYAISDLVVSRAGASGFFELLALNKPMLLIPLPKSASRGDQIENAEIFEKRGWASVLDQEKLTPDILLNEILRLLKSKKTRKTKAPFDAAELVASALLLLKK